MAHDLYHELLGLPPGPRPPNHYELLGIRIFEADARTIHAAALRQTTTLRQWVLHPDPQRARRVQEMLNEVGRAGAILENPEAKATYDAHLASHIGAPVLPASPPVPPALPPVPPPAPPVRLHDAPKTQPTIPPPQAKAQERGVPPTNPSAAQAHHPSRLPFSRLTLLVGGAVAVGIVLIIIIATTSGRNGDRPPPKQQAPAAPQQQGPQEPNPLARAKRAWASAVAAADVDLMAAHAPAELAAARQLARQAQEREATGNTRAAATFTVRATRALARAMDAARSRRDQQAVAQRAALLLLRNLDAAVKAGDTRQAQAVLTKLEALIPNDPRLKALRERLAALSGPDTVLTLRIGPTVTMELMLLRPGRFRMGSDDTPAAMPPHNVTLSKAFFLGRREVTQEQWQAIMGAAPRGATGPKHPVTHVSWDDCQAFLTEFNKRVRGPKYRLPTEAEWEYACRAGTTTTCSFGDDAAQAAAYAWCRHNAGGAPHRVGAKKPNPWGLFDMHGNVWEWCRDWYGPYRAANQVDPSGPARGEQRVLRGGSWANSAAVCSSACRYRALPGSRSPTYGFRIARLQKP